MKKLAALLLATLMLFSLVACEEITDTITEIITNNATADTQSMVDTNDTSNMSSDTIVQIKESPDKYTWYIKNYVGKNCANIGYTSLSGKRMDKYGTGILELVYISSDGTYIDINSDDTLKDYTIIGQNLAPNTELKYVFDTDSDGNEYDNLIAYQNHEKIVLNVKKVGSSDTPIALTSINPSPNKYTWYISDYVGRNLSNCGYISLAGNLMDKYGAAVIELIIVSDDGSYVDLSDEDSLKNYVVTKQNVAPNTELRLIYMKNSAGEEYENLVETQNIEEIEIYVKRISGIESSSPAKKITETTTAKSENNNSSTTLVNGMRQEFKDAMDAYEAFYTEYCDIMKSYKENPTDFTLLAKYADMLIKANQMNEAFEEWDDDELSSEELKYYLEVNNRVMKMLVDLNG